MVKRFLKAAAPLATLVCAAMTPSRGSMPARSYTAAYAALTSRIPAFARKYGLRCSACHTVWPELSAFGQRFKDNGYQLGNDTSSATTATRRSGKTTPTGRSRCAPPRSTESKTRRTR